MDKEFRDKKKGKLRVDRNLLWVFYTGFEDVVQSERAYHYGVSRRGFESDRARFASLFDLENQQKEGKKKKIF